METKPTFCKRKHMVNPLIYLGGGIMTHGENLAREEEYEQFTDADIKASVYSPVMNKSINDKSNMTEEENNSLAERIVAADINRLWKSDITVMCPEQSAIGTMCETAVLYAWKYMANKLIEAMLNADSTVDAADNVWNIIKGVLEKENYFHYFDIRTNHLNEKDWRRSFSINQMLYGMILYASEDGTLHNSFDEIIPILKERCSTDNNKSEGDE